MSNIKKERLTKLKNAINILDKSKINLSKEFIIDLDNELNLLYYSIPLIFENDFKYSGIDIIHNKTKKEFLEIAQDYLRINEFTKFLLFFSDEELDKRIIKYDIEKNNNLNKIKKNLEKIIKLL